MTHAPGAVGVRIVGTGSAVPERRLTNDDLSRMVDTSDEWIVQRTGIRERRVSDPSKEGTFTLNRDALKNALDASGMRGSDLDLVIVGTCTQEMSCPSVACRVAGEVGAVGAGAFDVVAACSGFVYSMNVADSLIRSGRFKRIGVCGGDAMSTVIDYQERSVSILFGDAAGAAVLVADGGENAIVIAPESNRRIADDEIDRFLAVAAPGDLLLVQNECSGLAHALRAARARGLRAWFNAAPADAQLRAMDLSEIGRAHV